MKNAIILVLALVLYGCGGSAFSAAVEAAYNDAGQADVELVDSNTSLLCTTDEQCSKFIDGAPSFSSIQINGQAQCAIRPASYCNGNTGSSIVSDPCRTLSEPYCIDNVCVGSSVDASPGSTIDSSFVDTAID